ALGASATRCDDLLTRDLDLLTQQLAVAFPLDLCVVRHRTLRRGGVRHMLGVQRELSVYGGDREAKWLVRSQRPEDERYGRGPQPTNEDPAGARQRRGRRCHRRGERDDEDDRRRDANGRCPGAEYASEASDTGPDRGECDRGQGMSRNECAEECP